MRVVAKFPFQYGSIQNKHESLNGKPRFLDRGEVIQLEGYKNDQKLVALGYLSPLESGTQTVSCDTCGRAFLRSALVNHKRKTDCYDEQGEPSRLDMAELLGVDYDKVRMDPNADGASITFDPTQVQTSR